MLTSIFCFYDKKQAMYLPPFSMQTRGAAIRMFLDMVNTPNEQSMVYKYSEDFDLYELATFDVDSGVITPIVRDYICNGSSLRDSLDQSVAQDP